MQTENTKQSTEDNETGKGFGPQGVDKAPGEETSQHMESVTQENLRGKKNDADPSEESGQPVKQD